MLSPKQQRRPLPFLLYFPFFYCMAATIFIATANEHTLYKIYMLNNSNRQQMPQLLLTTFRTYVAATRLPSPVSRLLCPVSCLPYSVSRLLFPVSCPVSCLPSPISCLPSPVSCLLSPVFCLPSPVSRLLSPVSCFPSPVSHFCFTSPVSRPLSQVSGLLRGKCFRFDK